MLHPPRHRVLMVGDEHVVGIVPDQHEVVEGVAAAAIQWLEVVHLIALRHPAARHARDLRIGHPGSPQVIDIAGSEILQEVLADAAVEGLAQRRRLLRRALGVGGRLHLPARQTVGGAARPASRPRHRVRRSWRRPPHHRHGVRHRSHGLPCGRYRPWHRPLRRRALPIWRPSRDCPQAGSCWPRRAPHSPHRLPPRTRGRWHRPQPHRQPAPCRRHQAPCARYRRATIPLCRPFPIAAALSRCRTVAINASSIAV